MIRSSMLLGVVVLAGTACERDVCGEYRMTTAENDAYYTDHGAPGYKLPSEAVEYCGGDYGTQGNWYRRTATVAFHQSGGDTAATFGELHTLASFRVTDAAVGVTLQVPALAGEAWVGTDKRDSAPLTQGSLTFHSETARTDSLDTYRVFDLEWDVTWINTRGAFYSAKGRDTVEMTVLDTDL